MNFHNTGEVCGNEARGAAGRDRVAWPLATEPWLEKLSSSRRVAFTRIKFGRDKDISRSKEIRKKKRMGKIFEHAFRYRRSNISPRISRVSSPSTTIQFRTSCFAQPEISYRIK